MFGGFAGSFFATKQGFISPESFNFLKSATILAIVVLGGMSSQIGVVLASIVMIGGLEVLRQLHFLKLFFGPDFDPSQLRMLLFGMAMVLVMLWKPRGLGLLPRADRLPQAEENRLLRSRGPGSRMMSQSWTQDPILTVEHLTMRFGGLIAVDDVSFTVGRNDITALIGPNGAGKTTVFNCLTGFYKPSEGRIAMRHGGGIEHLLERMDDFRIASTAKVARTFQNIRLFGGMTLLENLMISHHNWLMRASGYTLAGIFGLRGYRDRRGRS